MKKHTGAIIFFSIAVLYCVFWLISSICHHDRPISIVLIAVLLVLFAAQLYLHVKGSRKQDDQDPDR